MTEQEDLRRKREEEDYYLKKKSELPQSDKEAAKRYEKYLTKDPFPLVESALLNSADIFRYVAETGMIYPFDYQKLEGASYEVGIKGTVIWWDEDEGECSKELADPEDSFELQPNSIAFITLEPMFRIPDYMALRFNLKIAHVYKGLLLGTGPLVDPGFVGRLSIPLHNLTANTYVFKMGDGIIQMEFTKLSKNQAWLANHRNEGIYIRKRISAGRPVKKYIERALQNNQSEIVRSSIPEEISKVKKESARNEKEISGFKKSIEELKESTQDKIEKFVKMTQWVNVAIVAAVAAIAGAACTQMYQLTTIKTEQFDELKTEYEQCIQEYNKTKAELDNLIMELEKQIEELSGEKEEVSDGQEN